MMFKIFSPLLIISFVLIGPSAPQPHEGATASWARWPKAERALLDETAGVLRMTSDELYESLSKSKGDPKELLLQLRDELQLTDDPPDVEVKDPELAELDALLERSLRSGVLIMASDHFHFFRDDSEPI